MNRHSLVSTYAMRRVPRACGDEPSLETDEVDVD